MPVVNRRRMSPHEARRNASASKPRHPYASRAADDEKRSNENAANCRLETVQSIEGLMGEFWMKATAAFSESDASDGAEAPVAATWTEQVPDGGEARTKAKPERVAWPWA